MTKKLSVFFGIGIFIYILNLIFGPSSENKLIVVLKEELNALKVSWTSQVGRPPNEEEIEGIINHFYQSLKIDKKISESEHTMNSINNIFAINIDPNIAYKNSGCSLNKSGPGLTP